jgi:hypothetical protein
MIKNWQVVLMWLLFTVEIGTWCFLDYWFKLPHYVTFYQMTHSEGLMWGATKPFLTFEGIITFLFLLAFILRARIKG